MSASSATLRPSGLSVPPFEILPAGAARVPLVFASPHSGTDYPDDLLAVAALDPQALRRLEDCLVDRLFDAAPAHGAPLIRALFPRAFIDANREPFELDPLMFEDRLPPFVNTTSPRVQAGLGTIPRVVANGAEIYRGKLRYKEAIERLNRCYRPYHAALNRLLDETSALFGTCLLVDCHSMPSSVTTSTRAAVDIVIGDCHGTACAPAITDRIETVLRGLGYRVVRNDPYAGGFTTRHYGRPDLGMHALQIEINRALYLDEAVLAPHAGFDETRQRLSRLIEALARFTREDFARAA